MGHTPARDLLFHAGHGQVVIGDEVADTYPGMVVDVPPDVLHTVRSNSDGELLVRPLVAVIE